MIKMLFVFLILSVLLFWGLISLKEASKTDKKDLLKYTKYAILCIVLTTLALVGIYLIF